MFRFHKPLDIITLFHRPSLPSSIRVLNLLKQASAQASETATEDQASDHSHQNEKQRTDFELDVTEVPPTNDQLRTILEYVGAWRVKEVVEGARDERDAIVKLRQDPSKFQPPIVVDWNNGRAVVGENESEIIKMIRKISKDTKQ